MESVEGEKKKDEVTDIKRELIEGSFEKAVMLQKGSKLQLSEVKSIASTAFSELCSQNKYERAIELAERYNLPSEKTNEASLKGFTYFISKGEYEKAAKWGLEHKMSPSETTKAKIKIFESLISKKDIKGALKAVDEYNIPLEPIMNTANAAFSDAYQRKDYLSAAILGKEFNMSRKRVLIAAVNAFKAQIAKENWDGLIAVENEFNVLSDSVFDDILERDRESTIEIFYKNAIQENIVKGRAKLVIHILESTNILKRKYKDVSLKELMNKISLEIGRLHNLLLTKGNERDAIQIKDHFELLGTDALLEMKTSVIETAHSYHDVLLKKNQFDEAKNIKAEYGLFDKNRLSGDINAALTAVFEFLENLISREDFEGSMEVIKEYNIPKDKIAGIATKIIIDKLNKLEFESAFLILNELKIDPSFEELKNEAQNQFLDAFNSNHFEVAAEIGKFFKLDEKKTKVSAYKAWEKHMKNARYDKAFQFKKEYKIPSDWTEEVAREIYEYNMQISRPDIAKKIRCVYGIKYSLFDLIVEYIKRFFFRKKD
ncbi:MAG: hypothetical protein HWN67_01250 [Candidatus Helarchaeota archaeon]|nr:hypothetical protein [Candidatus Helarchaeota archaeon]